MQQLDSVLTVAIGRNRQDGSPLSEQRWGEFKATVAGHLRHAGTIVGFGEGKGTGSDGVNEGEVEENAIFLALVDADQLAGLRVLMAATLRRFNQTSAAFSFDLAHEPVFNTPNGWRPAEVQDFTADGHSRRTMPW